MWNFLLKQLSGRNNKAAGLALEDILHDTFPKSKKRHNFRVG